MNDEDQTRDHFGLNEPTGQFADSGGEEQDNTNTPSSQRDAAIVDGQPAPTDIKYKNMGWKGIDEAETFELDEAEEDISFTKEPIPEDELDMTPMVDVTFLLLIFFMVTASFTLQKSLEQPHAKSDAPSSNVQEDEENPDEFVQITVDQFDSFYVTTRDEDEAECPSASEMRARVRQAKESTNARRLIILAHVDSTHAQVITAWDAGVVNEFNEIEVQTTDEEF